MVDTQLWKRRDTEGSFVLRVYPYFIYDTRYGVTNSTYGVVNDFPTDSEYIKADSNSDTQRRTLYFTYDTYTDIRTWYSVSQVRETAVYNAIDDTQTQLDAALLVCCTVCEYTRSPLLGWNGESCAQVILAVRHLSRHHIFYLVYIFLRQQLL